MAQTQPELPNPDTHTTGVYLPDRDVEWGDEVTTPAHIELELILMDRISSDYSPAGTGHKMDGNIVGYITGNEATYRANNTLKEVDIPSTYSETDPDEIIGVCHETISAPDGAWGFTGRHIETAIRIANDNGRYSVDDYTLELVTGDHYPAILSSPAGSFVIAPQALTPDAYTTTVDVHGHEVIGEQDQDMIDALRHIIPLLEDREGIEVTGYSERKPENHVFDLADGRPLRFTHRARNTMRGDSMDELLGEYTFTPSGAHDAIESFDYTISEDDLSHDVGDCVDGAYVTGFTHRKHVKGDDNDTVAIHVRPKLVTVRNSDSVVSVSAANSGLIDEVHREDF